MRVVQLGLNLGVGRTVIRLFKTSNECVYKHLRVLEGQTNMFPKNHITDPTFARDAATNISDVLLSFNYINLCLFL